MDRIPRHGDEPVVPGTFAITAVPVPVVPPVPPATPPTPATPATPPTPTPGTVPPDALSILAPIAEVLEDAVTPLAGPQEQAIEDDGTPLAGYDRVNCWAHYYLIPVSYTHLADLAKNQGFFQIGNTWTARHYFERKSYTITFNNQGAMSTSAPIKYGTSIEGEGSAPSAKDAGVPEGSTFAGWYTSPTFAAGTEFSFDGATMPANNVVLYAKWILPTYQVTYYQDMGGTALAKRCV